MQDRQDQSDLLASQLTTGSGGLAFILAAIAFLFVNYGLALGCFAGAVTMFWFAHNFHAIARLRLQLPISIAEAPERSYTGAFFLSTYIAIGVSLLVSAIAVPSFYAVELRTALHSIEARQQVRHLLPDQKGRIRAGLSLGNNETYAFQINSMPSCDECEQFADELRNFFNSIPGWHTEGGPLFFMQSRPRRNLILAAKDRDHLAIVDKVEKAFADGGVVLARSNEEVQPDAFVIIVARPGD